MATRHSQKNKSRKTKMVKKKAETKGVYLRGRIWWITFIDAYGDRQRESSRSTKKKDAETFLAKCISEKAVGTPHESYKYEPLSLSKLRDTYMNSRPVQSTRGAINTALTPFVDHFKDAAVHTIHPDELKTFLTDRLNNGEAVSTLAMRHAYFRAALRDARSRKLVARKVVEDLLAIKRFKVKGERLRFLTVEEVIRILLCCPTWLQPVIIVGLFTGLRREEYCLLTWEMVDLVAGYLHLPATKGVKRRDIKLMPWVLDILRRLREAYPLSRHPFHTGNGKRLGACTLDHSFRAAVQRARVNDAHPHDTRHSFARWSILGGANIIAVQRMLGHAYLETTKKYTSLDDTEVHRIMGELGIPLAKRQVTISESRFVQLEQALEAHPRRHLLSPLVFGDSPLPSLAPAPANQSTR